MSVIIINISPHDGREAPCEYVVRVNHGPVLGRFQHWRRDGLAACLRAAAEAVAEPEKKDGLA